MKRALITAGGDVQAVGYREFVRKEAHKRNITGYVCNLDSGDVEILVEGKEEELKSFIDSVNTTIYPINVRELNVRWLEASGEFNSFKITRGDMTQELFERMDIAGEMLYRLLENSNKSLSNDDKMLDKQDQMMNKQDQMLNLQHETVEEIKGLRKDSGEYLQDEFKEIKKKLHNIEDALVKAGIEV